MTLSLQDASVVVIGGSSGIGLATAHMARAAGARVTIAGRDKKRLAEAHASLGGDVRTSVTDIADEDAVKDLFAGLDHVDHVAVLAGTHGGGPVKDVETAALRGPVDSRLWGPVYVCKYAAPRMTAGSLTFCTGAGVGKPRAGNGIVMAAAGGTEVFSRAMALELAPVRVNIIRPGIVDTPMIARMAGDQRDAFLEAQGKRLPLGRVAQAEDIAHAIGFLMTNEYVTGITLTVDGGFSLT